MSAEKEANQAFLPIPDEDDIEEDYNHWQYREASLRKTYLRRFAVVQLVILLLYAATFGASLRRALVSFESACSDQDLVCNKTSNVSVDQEKYRRGEEFVYTPAESVDKFHKVELNMHLWKENPYKGPPNEAVDEAWGKLFSNAYIRLSAEELAKLGRNSTLIQDGSGDYLGALDVYHQLHCVNFIFQYVHQDYYKMRKINVPKPDHLNHCIDVLRQVVMCYADTSISTARFHDDYERIWPEFKFQHSCRNWEAVDDWAGQPGRAVDQSDPDLVEAWLRNPNYVYKGYTYVGHDEVD